ncbi:hypothetical protein JCM5296_004946 [Sporobolomyces johnsonii]
MNASDTLSLIASMWASETPENRRRYEELERELVEEGSSATEQNSDGRVSSSSADSDSDRAEEDGEASRTGAELEGGTAR